MYWSKRRTLGILLYSLEMLTQVHCFILDKLPVINWSSWDLPLSNTLVIAAVAGNSNLKKKVLWFAEPSSWLSSGLKIWYAFPFLQIPFHHHFYSFQHSVHFLLDSHQIYPLHLFIYFYCIISWVWMFCLYVCVCLCSICTRHPYGAR